MSHFTQDTPAICASYQRHIRKTWYIAQRPGDGGVDWGWVDDVKKAHPMTPYWQRRFHADELRAGRKAVFYPVATT